MCYHNFKKSLVRFSCSVVSNSLQPRGLQHTRLPCLITNFWSLFKLMSITSVVPSNHLILCHPLLLPPSIFPSLSSVQFSSVAQSCPTLCNPMNRSTPGLPVHHQLPEFIQTHVHRVSDVIQSSHPLSSPSPPAPNPSQHQSLFQ